MRGVRKKREKKRNRIILVDIDLIDYNRMMLVSFLDNFFWQIGVDLGSSNTRVFVQDKGVVMEEATLLARIKKKRFGKNNGNGVVAVGNRAKEMQSREPKQLEVVAPIKNGIIADLEAAEKLAEYLLKLIYEIPAKYPKIFRSQMTVGVPSSLSEVQKRAVKSVFARAGAGKVWLAEDLVLAAVGLGLPMLDGGGVMIVDVGGGKSEAGVVSMGGVVVGRGIKTAGDDFDRAILNFAKMKYGILIGNKTAERVKMEAGKKDGGGLIIRGRDLESGLPKSIKMTTDEVREAVAMEVGKVARLVAEVLDETPPELMDDIIGRGIILVGGGSQTIGLKEMVEGETKITTTLAEDPEWSVVKGLGEMVNRSKKSDWVRQISLAGG